MRSPLSKNRKPGSGWFGIGTPWGLSDIVAGPRLGIPVNGSRVGIAVNRSRLTTTVGSSRVGILVIYSSIGIVSTRGVNIASRSSGLFTLSYLYTFD